MLAKFRTAPSANCLQWWLATHTQARGGFRAGNLPKAPEATALRVWLPGLRNGMSSWEVKQSTEATPLVPAPCRPTRRRSAPFSRPSRRSSGCSARPKLMRRWRRRCGACWTPRHTKQRWVAICLGSRRSWPVQRLIASAAVTARQQFHNPCHASTMHISCRLRPVKDNGESTCASMHVRIFRCGLLQLAIALPAW